MVCRSDRSAMRLPISSPEVWACGVGVIADPACRSRVEETQAE